MKYADSPGPRMSGKPPKFNREEIEKIVYRLRLWRDNKPCVIAKEMGCSKSLLGQIARGVRPEEGNMRTRDKQYLVKRFKNGESDELTLRTRHQRQPRIG